MNGLVFHIVSGHAFSSGITLVVISIYVSTFSLILAGSRSIAVIGDSLTAGVGGDEASETSPSILARGNRIHVQDISHIGETAASALNRVKSNAIAASVVIIEIGGNDLLGSTTVAQFAIDLDVLLSYLADPDRQIVMLELPLPPFCHEYGSTQRDVAARHRVTLVPKPVLLSVIAGSDSTLDTIHLSQSGHQLMADCACSLIKDAFTRNLEVGRVSSSSPGVQ